MFQVQLMAVANLVAAMTVAIQALDSRNPIFGTMMNSKKKGERTAMKKYILSFVCLMMMCLSAQAQSTNIKEIHLSDGTILSFSEGAIDSLRYVIYDGDTIGVKIYTNENYNADDYFKSYDYLWSNVSQVVYYDSTEEIDDNVNRNIQGSITTDDYPEAWRLEYPRIVGDDMNLVIVKKTDDYGITFSLEWDCTKKANRWTCYEIHDGNTASSTSRYSGNFIDDPDIPEAYQTHHSDYTGYGTVYNRGHLCPSADRLCSEEQNKQTFYCSNIHPQYANHNQGLWMRMESLVRDMKTDSRDTLYIVKGATIADGQYRTNDSISLIIPKYFYMAIMAYDKTNDKYHAVALWTEHKATADSNTNYGDYAITIDELEEKTGIDFFCNLKDTIETEVEAELDFDYWTELTRSSSAKAIPPETENEERIENQSNIITKQ